MFFDLIRSFLISAALAFLVIWAVVLLRWWIAYRSRWDVKDRWFCGGAVILLAAIPLFPQGLNMLFLSSCEEVVIFRVGRASCLSSLKIDIWGTSVGAMFACVLYQFSPSPPTRL